MYTIFMVSAKEKINLLKHRRQNYSIETFGEDKNRIDVHLNRTSNC
jgi:hypothetical protein